LIYGVMRIIDFSHTDRMTIAAYLFADLNRPLGIYAAMAIACISAALLAVVTERGLFAGLRRRGYAVMMICSLGLSIILQSIMAITHGSMLRTGVIREYPLTNFLNLYPREIVLLFGVPLVILCLRRLLHNTYWGQSLRATIDDYEKAIVHRLPVARLTMIAFAISGILAGASGIAIIIGTGVYPQVGFKYLIFAFAACIVGGVGNIVGALLASLTIGILITAAEFYGSALAAEGVTLLVLVAVLVFAPNGVFGHGLRRI